MEDTEAAHNCGGSPPGGAPATHVEVQEMFAEVIKKLGTTTSTHWWKLLGDEPNSLCHFLDVTSNEMTLLLRKCRVLYGPTDSFRTSEFEKLMSRCGVDYTTYRPSGKPEHFVKIGDRIDDAYAVEKPKETYSLGGILQKMPLMGVHLPGIRTKVSRRLTARMINASSNVEPKSNATTNADDNKSNKGTMTMYIDNLIAEVKKEIMYASRQGKSYVFTQRAERMLRKAAVLAMTGAVQDLFEAWVDRLEAANKQKEVEGVEECTSTPASSTRRVATEDLSRRMIFAHTPSTAPGLRVDNNHQPIPQITPPVDLTEVVDVEVDESDIDIVITQLKEQTLLQNLFHKQLMDKNERVLVLEHKNGRRLRLFIPPDCQNTKSFVDEAKRTHWINDMLHNDVQRDGVLLYLAKTQPETYLKVANARKLRISPEVLNTPQTIALGRLCGLNDTQMAKLRSFLNHVGKAELKLVRTEVSRIDREVGLHPNTPVPTFDTFLLEWSTTKSKGVEKKLPEHCSYWNANVMVEVASEIDLCFHSMFVEEPNMVIKSLDYYAPGFIDKPGIIVLFGGDHGAGACPCSMKLNFSSPQQRKERGELNWRCPTIQIASIDCSKDSFELLANTVMPAIKSQLIQLRSMSAYIVYCHRRPHHFRKAFLWPNNVDPRSVQITDTTLTYQVGVQHHSINLQGYFDADENDFSFADLRVTKVISNFHDLYVGDLAFLCMTIGMNNSAGSHCVHCKVKRADFSCESIQTHDVRTKASLTESLNVFNLKRLSSKSVRNHHGANSVGLLDIDPQRIIVPILHCPMGLVDKILEVFKAWTVWEVELLPDESDEVRQAYKNAKAATDLAVQATRAADAVHQTSPTAQSAAALKEATATQKNAKAEEKIARDISIEMTKRHSARLFSLSQKFDTVFRSHGIKKEHYHGGKHNGVNCIRIMERSEQLFSEFADAIKARKIETVTEALVEEKCSEFARLFGLLDVVWSSVRGIDGGLLPTNDQIETLRKALLESKRMWLSMGIGTMQPKWHMTFDGHLLYQVIKYGGIADKSDKTIEFQHQVLMKLRDRYRSITSYQRKETCIRRELRRQKSPEIQSHIDTYKAAKKRAPGNMRQQPADEPHQEQREAKRVKREAVLEG